VVEVEESRLKLGPHPVRRQQPLDRVHRAECLSGLRLSTGNSEDVAERAFVLW
jgi:hypothetical protein